MKWCRIRFNATQKNEREDVNQCDISEPLTESHTYTQTHTAWTQNFQHFSNEIILHIQI